jgi:thioredoxin 1
MDPQTFFERLKQNPRPVVVDLWAPWCGPCKAVKPTLEKLAQEYAGRVDLWEINADESQELLRQLKVYGIPTLIGYRNEEETVRYVGAKPRAELKSLFEALSNGTVPTSSGLSVWNRFIRLMAAGFVAGIGWASHYNWFLLFIGGILVFSAVYDRCPIWKAITTQFKEVMAK